MATININTNIVNNIAKVAAYGKPFYAADLGLNGGEINGLCYHEYIVPTGNTRETFMEVGRDDLYRKVTVKEWKFNPQKVEAIKAQYLDLACQLTVLAALL